MTNLSELVAAMKQAYENGYMDFGVRTIENAAGILKVGDSVPDSYNWDYENDISTRETTGETLPGACAVEIVSGNLMMDGTDDEDVAQAIKEAVERAKIYYGEQILLIAGKYGAEYGSDSHEIIIRDADVIAIAK